MSQQRKEHQEGNGVSGIGNSGFHTPQTKGWRVQTAQGQRLGGLKLSSPMFPLTHDKHTILLTGHFIVRGGSVGGGGCDGQAQHPPRGIFLDIRCSSLQV